MRRQKKCFPTVSGIGTKIDYRFIDKAIRPLIRVLNAHPYVQTFSCCEGHGLSRNSFYVWLGAKGREARDFLREGARMAWHAEFGHKKEKGQRPTQKDLVSSSNSHDKIWEWGVLIESVRDDLVNGDKGYEGFRIVCDAVGEEQDSDRRAVEIRRLADMYAWLLKDMGIEVPEY